MPRTRASRIPATEPKTHRSARTASEKRVRAPSPPDAIPEPANSPRHEEIAEVAYRNWLGRTDHGSPEEDWLKAEIEVHARYAGQGG